MDEEEIEKAVLAYLRKKGYKQAESALHEEQKKHHHLKSAATNNNSNNNNSSSNSNSINSQTDPDIARQILSFAAELENSPAQYQEGYSKLRSWAHSSLDSYKVSKL